MAHGDGRPHDPEFIRQAIDLTREGLSRREVAERLHVSRNSIVGIITRHAPAMKHEAVPWSPERIAQVRALSKDGKSQREIARLLGSSAARINTTIRRHCPDLVGTYHHGKSKSASKARRDGSVHHGLGNIIARNKAAIAAYVPPPAEPPTPTMVDLMGLTVHMCKYALSERPFLFCGAGDLYVTPEGSVTHWCRYHASRVYQPRPPRRAA